MAIVIGTTNRYCPASVEVLHWEVMVSPSSNGLVISGTRAPNPSKSWTIALTVATYAEVSAVMSEFATAKGSAGEVTFTPPTAAAAITCRFAADSLSWSKRSASDYEIRYTLVQDVAPQ